MNASDPATLSTVVIEPPRRVLIYGPEFVGPIREGLLRRDGVGSTFVVLHRVLTKAPQGHAGHGKWSKV